MTAFLFPGQGSQIKGMGADLFDQFTELTQQADEILGYSIKSLCLEDKDQQLNHTAYTQPALYVVNALSYQQALGKNGPPGFVAGHSLGEYNALQAAGVFSFADGLKLVKKRGELMSEAQPGAMAAILELTAAEVERCLQQQGLSIDIANYNTPTQTVIAGLTQEIEEAQQTFEQAGGIFVPLNTSGPFHSRYMDAAKTEFEDYLKGFTFAKPTLPVIANLDGQPYQEADIFDYLAKQLTHPVRWVDTIYYLFKQGERDFIELGAGEVLIKFIPAIRQAFFSQEERETKITQPDSKDNAPNANTNRAEQTLDEAEIEARKKARQQQIAALHQRIEDWNKTYPIGTQVVVKGFEETFTTRTKALVLFGHRGAIYMEGYNGYFALDDVTPCAKQGVA
jgi:malonyl CoA-acyl carrier protein transacylase